MTWPKVQEASLTGIPDMKAVRFAASSGAKPRMTRSRYVDRVGRSGRVEFDGVCRLDDSMPVLEPDPAAERTAGPDDDRAARKERPSARVPRVCPWPAMTHCLSYLP